MHHEVETLLTLLLIATSVAILVRYIQLPYTVMLVLGGLVLGVLHYLPEVEMTPEIVMTIFLPILLFEASINIEYSHLRADMKSILTMAVFGVVISLFVTGGVMHWLGGMPWMIALLFGSMIVATDPVSVLSIFKKLGVPHRLTAIVEGESLFNDGTAIVAFQIILAVVVTGHFSAMEGLQKFLLVCLGGLAVGLVIAYGAIVLLEKIDDHLLELMITTVLAYGTYLVAESLHVSGVIAVVTAGIMVGNMGWERAMTPTTRVAVLTFWEYAAFVINSLIFLLIGLQIHLNELLHFAPIIGAGILALFAGRILAIYPLAWILNLGLKARLPMKWMHILVWGNLKGALSMALVMSLPADVPYRKELLVTIFGVVLFSLLGPGLSMNPFLKILKLSKKESFAEQFELLQGELVALRSALAELELMHGAGKFSKMIYEEQKVKYSLRLEEVERDIGMIQQEEPKLVHLQSLSAERHLLVTQKSSVRDAFRNGILSESSSQALIHGINRKIYDLELSDPDH
ncbi:Na+/H+ antiporter [bacterium (Candidatus Blackallbacteria) CG17_big_fil_post_rev_8_21_14_2_50_48_46]|uniref:Na+/H+ antiporter n=1 Tax=bacterium (Candidatus Blackallbacteria) CG17_big_fil_post_rev_8_21_14_2_50_48_46 TaxID=2014261 RepID=A0A2M7FXD9_9BACT|nr:MAG: Na+/H+ antiporter [bacterium (Candidatus Blackallbacteria) CG18_big_fil_WC_8_21_14_2_50_49_26]PIW13947.1 MAG: Na+/H+ antiporter [bacterium (Candidatus Blackallbacteria) CG17_big_fil_post_rev_8_21_14_2_50_48_46]PIW46798.1 MAG: Na+/H+ antiporter [bacterium (Candidatus Blackallbacteria) CG13_big_fil_rev_8_21_14_2_50_49_14]